MPDTVPNTPPMLSSEVPTEPYTAVIANPYSGAVSNAVRVEALVEQLRLRGMPTRVVWDREGLGTLAQSVAFGELCRCVVAAGGDGTLSRVINHELGRVPIAHYPLGNENLFAKQFGFTSDPVAMAEAIVRGRTQTVDVGEVKGERFSIVTSAGFDGAVAHRLHDLRCSGGGVRQVGRLTYLKPILATMFGYRYPMIDVIADGRTMRGALVMVFNLPQYAMKLSLLPQADPHDGLLDYLVFERPGPLALMRYAIAAMFGSRHLKLRDVHVGKAARIELRPSAAEGEPDGAAVPLEIDGEAAGHLPVEIAVQPGGLLMLVP